MATMIAAPPAPASERTTRMQLAVPPQPDLPGDEIRVDGRLFRRHAKGGGLVEVTAFVGGDVYVAPGARINDNAIVLGRVRLLDRAVIEHNAMVVGRCELRGDSSVGGNAVLVGMVTLRRHARVDGIARLDSGVFVDHHAHITWGYLAGNFAVG